MADPKDETVHVTLKVEHSEPQIVSVRTTTTERQAIENFAAWLYETGVLSQTDAYRLVNRYYMERHGSRQDNDSSESAE
jgi:hypothetical protein